jgi:hypothetical protein
VLRVAFPGVFGAAVLGLTLCVCPAAAQDACGDGALGDLPVPGGMRGALAAAGEPATADRSQFLSEIIRSTRSAIGSDAGSAAAAMTSLLTFLDAAGSASETSTASLGPAGDTLPLPLPAAVWRTVVFRGQVTSDHLLAAILRSREASLLYYGLLALDDGTRAWLCGQPSLLQDVASGAAARFLLAAPALRVAGGTIRVPGGDAARTSWEALVGAPVAEPEAFVRALLVRDEGRLAYFFGAMGSLDPDRARFALGTEIGDTLERLAAAHRLFAAFRRISQGWEIDRRPFRRPPLDPGLLAGDMRVDRQGRPLLPGTRRFWALALGERTPRDRDLQSPATYRGTPVDFPWLCEQVFGSDARRRQDRYHAVLYASRQAPRIQSENAGAAVEAVRAAIAFPALTAALERAHVDDPAIVARAGRRAAQLSDNGNAQQAIRTIAQFQGLLAVIVRAAARGALPRDQVAGLVSSLSAVEPGESGDYEGRLLRWIESNLDAGGAGGPEARLKRLVAGGVAASPRVVEWEGTRYRVDLAHAEALRLSTLLGRQHRPLLASAAALVSTADGLAEPDLAVERVEAAERDLARAADALALDGTGWRRELTDRYRKMASDLAQAARSHDASTSVRVARQLRVLSDDLLARGLVELVYASALGQPDRDWIAAQDLADRHDFVVRPPFAGPPGSWDPPAPTVTDRPGLGVGGSLLGLDVAFAEFSLVRVSSKPPAVRPTLADVNRRALVESVALVEPAALTDDDRDTIASGIRHGRERAAAVRTRDEASAIARELRVGGMRSSLLAWLVTRDAADVPRFFSRGELLQLGLGAIADESTLHAWGAPARARVGCLCLRLFSGSPERLLGRVNSGVLMSVVPDLNLHLAELLARMQMPATLFAPVLAAATLELVNTARSRDEDDRRGLAEVIDGLGQDRLEQYLALLTSDGPLVPVDLDATVPTEVQR